MVSDRRPDAEDEVNTYGEMRLPEKRPSRNEISGGHFFSFLFWSAVRAGLSVPGLIYEPLEIVGDREKPDLDTHFFNSP